jgi:sugar phosphate isomerase/epimerase
MNTVNHGKFENHKYIKMNQSRREFIKKASAVSAGAIIGPKLFPGQQSTTAKTYPVCVFTKCLQFLDYQQLGETLANIGFTGAELGVRDGGHVLPQNVKTDLPKAIKTLQKSGISVPMMVSGIVNPDDPLTEIVLGTAAEQGVGYYRMGYLNYDPAKSVTENLTIHKKTFDKLETINRKYGIHGCYQNHAGTGVGAPVWDLYWLVNGCDPQFIGVQYDIRHAVAEGGTAWPVGLKLLSPWIKTTPIKDFYWNKVNGRWRIADVPLSQGMVDFDGYFKRYKSLGISGPVTIHYEYNLGGAESGSKTTTMSVKEISEIMKTDLNWLKKKLIEYGIPGSSG